MSANGVYGRLTILKEVEKGKVLCQCTCGEKKVMLKNNVIYGKSKSCGCLSREYKQAKAEDLTGKRFGELIAIEFAGYKGKRRAWRCKCSCGNESIVCSHDLKSGHTHSCGCLRIKNAKALYENIQGNTYGDLIVLQKTSKRSKKGSVIWRCYCNHCGSISDISHDSLVYGKYQSCGCRKKEAQQNVHKYLHYYKGTCKESLKRKLRSDNKTGIKGVSITATGKYRATIGFMQKRYNLGMFDDLEQATKVREEAFCQLHEKFIFYYEKWEQEYKAGRTQEEFVFEVHWANKQFSIRTNTMFAILI